MTGIVEIFNVDNGQFEENLFMSEQVSNNIRIAIGCGIAFNLWYAFKAIRNKAY